MLWLEPPIALNDTVVVVGAGMIGLLIIQSLRLAGCGRIIAVDIDRSRLDLACQFDADLGLKSDVVDVPAGEEHLLSQWQAEDSAAFQRVDTTSYYHQVQDQEFLQALLQNREPAVSGIEGRKTVELFTAIYRSQRDHRPVKFPLTAEDSLNDLDGRLSKHPG